MPCTSLSEVTGSGSSFVHVFMNEAGDPYDPLIYNLADCEGRVATTGPPGSVSTERCEVKCQAGYSKDPAEDASTFLCRYETLEFIPDWGTQKMWPTCQVKVCGTQGRPDVDPATNLQVPGTWSNCGQSVEYRNQCSAKCTLGYRYEVVPWPNPTFVQDELWDGRRPSDWYGDSTLPRVAPFDTFLTVPTISYAVYQWPFEYTCALDESGTNNTSTWNIPPVMGTQAPHVVKFFPTTNQGKLALTLTSSNMNLVPGFDMICSPQPCENIYAVTK